MNSTIFEINFDVGFSGGSKSNKWSTKANGNSWNSFYVVHLYGFTIGKAESHHFDGA